MLDPSDDFTINLYGSTSDTLKDHSHRLRLPSQLSQRPFKSQQLSFHGQPTGEPTERCVVSDNPVTGDDDRNWIRAKRVADRSGVVPASDS